MSHAWLRRCWRFLRWLLSSAVNDVAPSKTRLTQEECLLYFYYGGMVYIGLKRFRDALESFRVVSVAAAPRRAHSRGYRSPVGCLCLQCLIVPAAAVSRIVVEAFKKYALVSIIVHGQVRVDDGAVPHAAPCRGDVVTW